MDRVINHAYERGIRVLVDAEHTYFQPAIDNTVLYMQRKYNKEKLVVYNTFQCYLKDAVDRIDVDLKRAQHEG